MKTLLVGLALGLSLLGTRATAQTDPSSSPPSASACSAATTNDASSKNRDITCSLGCDKGFDQATCAEGQSCSCYCDPSGQASCGCS
jgi:hypothetical protein